MEERRVAVVTGAGGAIGAWIALGLARAGLHVVLVARNAARGAVVRDWVERQVPGATTEMVLADPRVLGQIRMAGASIAARHKRVAILVNNAGLLTRHRTLTEEGRETVLAVNHLAPFLLTRVLEKSLRSAGQGGARARIVNIGSAASDRARIDLDDLECESDWGVLRAYSQSKLALMLATFEWSRRLADGGVTANIVYPGLIATGSGRLPGIVGIAWQTFRYLMLSPEHGAEAVARLALAPELDGVSGRYFKRDREATPNELALDQALATRLWAATERLIEVPQRRRPSGAWVLPQFQTAAMSD